MSKANGALWVADIFSVQALDCLPWKTFRSCFPLVFLSFLKYIKKKLFFFETGLLCSLVAQNSLPYISLLGAGIASMPHHTGLKNIPAIPPGCTKGNKRNILNRFLL